MKIGSEASFTFRALHEKEKRSLAILELIRKKNLVSRTDISKITGINLVSVSNYIHNYIAAGLVLEKGLAVSSGGRKPELVELGREDNFVVGIDICGTTAAAAVVGIGMNIIRKKRATMPPARREAAPAVTALVDDLLKDCGISKDKVRAAGIGVCDEALLHVRDAVEEHLDVRTFTGSAPVCGAFAEKVFNPDAGVERLLYVYSDLGKGVIIEGDLCIGCAPYAAGEERLRERSAGKDPGVSSPQERDRYLEPWSSYLGMTEYAVREVSRGVGTGIVALLSGRGVEAMTDDIVIESARAGDETASNIVGSVALTLGLRIAYLVNLYGPQVVVLGGGIEKAVDVTMPFIAKMVKKLSLKEYSGTLKIAPAAAGDDALCLGAAALAAREIFLSA